MQPELKPLRKNPPAAQTAETERADYPQTGAPIRCEGAQQTCQHCKQAVTATNVRSPLLRTGSITETSANYDVYRRVPIQSVTFISWVASTVSDDANSGHWTASRPHRVACMASIRSRFKDSHSAEGTEA
jgi:hypothetical protein